VPLPLKRVLQRAKNASGDKMNNPGLYTRAALFVALAIALALPFAAGCRCSQPGEPGKIVGFTCQNGTTDNVSFYIPAAESSPETGAVIFIWARRNMSEELVPVNKLDITVTLNSEEVSKLATDEDGYATFIAEEPGTYLLKGGDAKVEFTVAEKRSLPEPQDAQSSLPDPALPELGREQEPQQASDDTFNNYGPKTKRSWQDGDHHEIVLYAGIITAVVVALMFILKNEKRNKK